MAQIAQTTVQVGQEFQAPRTVTMTISPQKYSTFDIWFNSKDRSTETYMIINLSMKPPWPYKLITSIAYGPVFHLVKKTGVLISKPH